MPFTFTIVAFEIFLEICGIIRPTVIRLLYGVHVGVIFSFVGVDFSDLGCRWLVAGRLCGRLLLSDGLPHVLGELPEVRLRGQEFGRLLAERR